MFSTTEGIRLVTHHVSLDDNCQKYKREKKRRIRKMMLPIVGGSQSFVYPMDGCNLNLK